MSNLATVKQAVRDWLESKVRVDSWDLDLPPRLFSDSSTQSLPLPAMSATSYPVKDLYYERGEGGGAAGSRITGYAGLTFSLAYRFPGVLTVEQLPTDELEAIAEFLYVSSLIELQGCDGIQRLEPEASEFPIQITRMEDSQSDWLMYAHMAFNLQFSVTSIGIAPEYVNPGAGPPGDGSQLREINIKIYRGEVEQVLTSNVLDSSLTIERE